MRRILTLTCLAAISLATLGCGLEYTDTRARYRPTTDLDHGVNVEPDKMVCPNMVLLREGKGDLTEVKRVDSEPLFVVAVDQVQDAFGPYVPCNTVLSGSDTCPKCEQTVSKGAAEVTLLTKEDVQSQARQAVAARIAGRAPPEKKASSVAVPTIPAVTCPYEDCGKVISVGSGSLESETGKNATLGDSYCYHCKRYVSFVAQDVSASVHHKEELLCPSCSKAVDSTLSICRNKSCKLHGKLLNTNPTDGPCWSCGATAHCPNCLGSGTGSSSYDTTGWSDTYPSIKASKTPDKCYYCEGSGLCPECEGDGFLLYEPSVPQDFQLHTGRGDNLKVVPATKRKWEHPKPKGGAGDGGDEGGEDK